jgi:hypothetical protein
MIDAKLNGEGIEEDAVQPDRAKFVDQIAALKKPRPITRGSPCEQGAPKEGSAETGSGNQVSAQAEPEAKTPRPASVSSLPFVHLRARTPRRRFRCRSRATKFPMSFNYL